MKKLNITPDALSQIDSYQIPAGELGFGKYFGPVMLVSEYHQGQWGPMEVVPFGPLSINPAAKVLHYGQEIFEGMKAYKGKDDKILLFRPEQNARRFNESAERLCMPTIPEADFINAVKIVTAHSKKAIPSEFGASLYLRPFMIATEPALGVRTSLDYQFIIITGPSGNYFSGKTVKMRVERSAVRAAQGGTGYAKAGGNYAASLLSGQKTEKLGCDQTLWLDGRDRQYIEEASGMNFCCIIDGVLHTPTLTDSILPGVTRKSLIHLAESLGISSKESKLNINEVEELILSKKCTEAFLCGTASVIAPIQSIHEDDGRVFRLPEPDGKLSLKLKEKLLNIQTGKEVGPAGWVVEVHS